MTGSVIGEAKGDLSYEVSIRCPSFLSCFYSEFRLGGERGPS